MRKSLLIFAAMAFVACREHTKSKPSRPAQLMDGVMRVVVIGDSLAYGTGDDTGKGIAGNLADDFKLRGISADVRNYGVKGATTADVEGKLDNYSIRADLIRADAIVLSVGANNVFQDPEARARAIRDRDTYAQEILEQVAGVVGKIRAINPDAELILLGGYNPLPDHPLAGGISRYVKNWDKLLNRRFESDPLIDVVKTSDIVDSGNKLAADHFHPGTAAYRDIAKRIADMLAEQIKSV